MPDTHDDGGMFRAAFEAAIAVLPANVAVIHVEQAVMAALRAAAPLQQAQLREQLAAATARAEKAEATDPRKLLMAAYRNGFADALETATYEASKTADRQARAFATNFLAELSAHDGRDAMAADAAQDGLSATETDDKASQASGSELECERAAAGLSEPKLFAEDCDCDCQPGQPCLCPERDCYCGPCRVCGDNPQQRDDDTTAAAAQPFEAAREPELSRDPAAWCWAPNPNGPLRCGRLRDHEPPHRRGDRTWIDDDTTEGR